MGFLIGLLTFFLVLNCIVLILLVLVQLPKKDAGAGLAFGGGATDALFGAGSGTVLTKITKYSAALFFGLALVLAVIQKHRSTVGTTEFERHLATEPARKLPLGTPVAPAPLTPTPAPAESAAPGPSPAPVPQQRAP
jgi:preprotein translocase subunit SecG